MTDSSQLSMSPPRRSRSLDLGPRVQCFQHLPLDLQKDSASIRLIQVLPRDERGQVPCRMQHATIEAKYTCVSYVWGPADDPRTILINDEAFLVRRNIYDFLQSISSEAAGLITSLPRDAPRLFWIDALCIDQTNNREKNHQVQQMGAIFSRAQLVLAWMGNKRQIASYFDHVRRSLLEQGRKFDRKSSADYYAFVRDEYWKRAWVCATLSGWQCVV